MFVSDSKKLIFLHNPKCGGTSIREALARDVHDFKAVKSGHSLPSEVDSKRKRYHKIVFVRNTWTRLVSIYEYINRLPKLSYYFRPLGPLRGESFETFLHSEQLKSWYVPQTKYIEGVNDIHRFERIEEEYQLIRSRLWLGSAPLHRANSMSIRDYWAYYNDDMAQYVSEWLKKEIRTLGYRFGQGEAFREIKR